MPFILIKNNLKLMLRNKWIIGLMIAGPLIVIAVLSNSFDAMMKSYEEPESCKVGYRISEDSIFSSGMEALKEACKDVNMELAEYPDATISEILANGECDVFVEFETDGYTISKTEDAETSAATLKYLLNQFTLGMEQKTMGTADQDSLSVTKITGSTNVNSKDYYGIIYTVYFAWCSFISLASVISSERKNRIGKKYTISPVSKLGLYLAKLVPCVLATTIELAIMSVLATAFFDIHWGSLGITLGIMFLTIICASAFGIFLIDVFQNLAVSIVIEFTVVWVLGLIGGSFETYMYSIYSESVKLLSPIYHINRTLVELSANGSTTYTTGCVLYLLGITAVCMTGSLMIKSIRKGEVA